MEIRNFLIDYINRMEGSDSLSERWACLTDTLAALGFNAINYTIFPNTDTYEDPVFIENFRNGWSAYYAAQEYAADDSMIPHVLNSDVPALMLAVDEMQPLVWSARGRQIIAEAKDAGMERAIGFSHRNSAGRVDGGIAIGTDMMSASDFSASVEKHIPLLHTIYSIAYQHMHPECRQAAAVEYLDITPRQYDLIMALWDGLSNKQIAELLGVSEVTVSFHLKQLRRKLGCRLNREIIPKAYRYGLLSKLPKLVP